jgi:hypothetical protein
VSSNTTSDSRSPAATSPCAIIEGHGDVVGLAGVGDALRLLEVVVLRAGAVRLGVDQRRARLERVVRVGEDRQVLVLDLDQFQRRLGDGLRLRRDGGDLVAQAAHAVGFQREVVLGDADRALPGHVGGGDHRMHAGQRLRRRGVDGLDLRMHPGGAQDLAVELALHVEVLDVARLAAGFFRRIELGDALADEGILLDGFGHLITPCSRPLSHR